MRLTGILSVVCPALLEQVGCGQNRYHAYDVWTHTLKCVDACPADPIIRMAALLHDLGKPRTKAYSSQTEDYTFYGHEKLGADLAETWLSQYRFSNDERARVVHLIRHHLVCYTDAWSGAAVRRFLARVGIAHVDSLLALCRADTLAKGLPVDDALAALQRLRERIDEVIQAGAALETRDLAIDGHDVMAALKCDPGPLVGRMLRRLLERVVEQPELNRRETLLAMLDGSLGEEG